MLNQVFIFWNIWLAFILKSCLFEPVIIMLVSSAKSTILLSLFTIYPEVVIGKVKKAKCTLVQPLRHCTSRTAHRGSKVIALLLHDHGTRNGWHVSVTSRPLFTQGKDPVTIAQEAGWAPGPVWTGAENLAPTGIRSLDCPARSQSLYQLHYPAHSNDRTVKLIYYSNNLHVAWIVNRRGA